MLVKPAGKQVDFSKMDKAQKHNGDGYGVAWFEDGFVKEYKSFNYNQFKGVVAALKQHQVVVHLRYATKGNKSYSNIHPFMVPSGVMFHNGTMWGLGDTVTSDSQELANTISECTYEAIEDIEPLIRPFINDKINRLVFFEDSGRVTIMNKDLGVTEDGIWYSNDYHKKDEGWCRVGDKPKVDPKPKMEIVKPSKKHKVFVYGTLKRGYHNHRLLKDATMLGKAFTADNWTMVGKDMSFPYVLEQHDTVGTNVIGEVYHVSDAELKTLNTLEGVPYHYKPQLVEVQYDDNTIDEVLMYVKSVIPENYLDSQMLISEWKSA